MKLIRSIAWSFHFTTGIPFEDLYSEACLAYCKGVKVYDAKDRRASRTTYLYRYITNGVITFVRGEQHQKNIIWEMEYRKQEYQRTPQYEYFENDYPADVRTVITIIQDPEFNPDELPPKLARGILFRELIGMGWTHKRSWDAIRETRKLVMQTEIGCII